MGRAGARQGRPSAAQAQLRRRRTQALSASQVSLSAFECAASTFADLPDPRSFAISCSSGGGGREGGEGTCEAPRRAMAWSLGIGGWREPAGGGDEASGGVVADAAEAAAGRPAHLDDLRERDLLRRHGGACPLGQAPLRSALPA